MRHIATFKSKDKKERIRLNENKNMKDFASFYNIKNSKL